MRRPEHSSAVVAALLAALVAVMLSAAGVVQAVPGAPRVGPEGTPGTGRFPGLEGGPAGLGSPCRGPATVCADRLLFGLATNDSDRMGPVFAGLERDLGTKAHLVESYQDFTSYFDVPELTRVVGQGRTPVVTWEPVRSTAPTKDSFPLASIAAGKFDTYLRSRAAQVARVPGEVIIRFGHEMNGFWYPWGQPRALHPRSIANPANTPARYVAAYRHVWRVFEQAGVRNVTWMWSPNVVDANAGVTLASLYPGDSYVDVVGLSGYFHAADSAFEERFRVTATVLAEVAGGKPLIVAETGVMAGPNRPEQLAELFAGLYDLPQLVGVIYFSVPDTAIDYRLQGDPVALAAARAALGRQRVGERHGDELALAVEPVVRGTPLVGQDLQADLAWRGVAGSATSRWWSCAEPVLDPTVCRVVGFGDEHTVGLADRGRYLFSTLGVVSPRGTDTGTSRPLGPVRSNPPAVPVEGIDLLADAVRIRFGTPAEGLTHWLVSVDDPGMAAPVYLPVATPTHYLTGLAAGTTHTVTVASCDCPQRGAATSYSFGVVTRPAAPLVERTSVDGVRVALPPPAAGQTGWALRVDAGEPTVLGPDADHHDLAGLSPGSHAVHLARVAGDGRTSFASTAFTLP